MAGTLSEYELMVLRRLVDVGPMATELLNLAARAAVSKLVELDHVRHDGEIACATAVGRVALASTRRVPYDGPPAYRDIAGELDELHEAKARAKR